MARQYFLSLSIFMCVYIFPHCGSSARSFTNTVIVDPGEYTAGPRMSSTYLRAMGRERDERGVLKQRENGGKKGKKEFTNCKMQLSALVRGLSRSAMADPTTRVGGDSVPGVTPVS